MRIESGKMAKPSLRALQDCMKCNNAASIHKEKRMRHPDKGDIVV